MKRAAMVMMMMSDPEIQTYNISGTQPTHTHNVIMLLDEFIRKQKKKKNSRTLK